MSTVRSPLLDRAVLHKRLKLGAHAPGAPWNTKVLEDQPHGYARPAS